MISIQDFKNVELRVARVDSVEDIEGKDKLYKMQIDLGGESRQIVAGIKQYYSKQELFGKNIIVITNLQPAKIAGLESQAMLLAAKK